MSRQLTSNSREGRRVWDRIVWLWLLPAPLVPSRHFVLDLDRERTVGEIIAPLDIAKPLSDEINVVIERAASQIAGEAEKPPYQPCCVIVVHT